MSRPAAGSAPAGCMASDFTRRAAKTGSSGSAIAISVLSDGG
ncbi:MAG: hypothetical protein PHE95_03600 [Candidatus Methanomethylophilus sp.]|nr:hypothetical protein [Methanomethylophilus sp.]